jgi:competence protein ComEC
VLLGVAVACSLVFAASCVVHRAAAVAARSLLAIVAVALAFGALGAATRARDASRALPEPRLGSNEPARRGWLVGRVRGLPETGTGDTRLRLEVERSTLGLARGAALAFRTRGGPVPADGDRVAVFAEVKGGMAATNPGGFDDARFLRVARLAGRAEAIGPSLRRLAPPAPWDLAARVVSPLRARLLAQIRAQERGRAGAFLAGFLLGDRSALGSDAVDDLRRIGALHLLAISGMHVVLAVALLARATRLAGLRGRRAALVRLLGVVGYSALAGGSASVWRAGVSGALVEVGALAGRRVRAEQGLALTVLVLALARPTSPLDAGFQLSVLATWGLLALAQPLQRIALEGLAAAVDAAPRAGFVGAASRGVRGFAPHALDAVVPTVMAQLASLPVIASQFGAVSALGLVSNVLLVPVTNLALVAGLLALAATAPCPPWAGLVWPVADACALATLRVADALARSPAALRPLAASPGALALLGASVAAFGWPAARRRVLAHAGLAPAVAGAGLAALVAIAAPDEHGACGVFRWTLLDVGQGDGQVLEFPDGRHWLVDAGDATPGRDHGVRVVLPALRARGIARLDAVVVTHADRDHAGGVPAVLRDVPSARVLGPSDVAREVLDRARGRGGAADARTATHAVTAGETLLVAPQARVMVLWPPRGFAKGADPRWNTNRESVVLRVELLARDTLAFLLTGDADTLVERAVVARGLARGDVLKVGHHGSRTSSGAALLDALAPEVALASVGRVNRFGHPHRDVVARIRAHGTAWRSTAEEGALDLVAWTEADGRWRWRIERARGGGGPRAVAGPHTHGVAGPRACGEAPRAPCGPCQPGRPGGNVRRE